MARIRIEDLPIAEHFTPEEEEQIEGAGRPSFRPMLESLEGREMYTANVTAVWFTPLPQKGEVLQVRAEHIPGTPQNDRVAISKVGPFIQLFKGTENEKIGQHSADHVKSIDVVMSGGINAIVDLTGLGNLSGDARNYVKGDAGTADVRYLNQAGNQVREWDSSNEKGELQIHNKETKVGSYRVLEQSRQEGTKILHSVTVDKWNGRKNIRVVTGQDNGNGFEVTTKIPGVSGPNCEVTTKFDRYGGMWDGRAWVPEVGQKLVGRLDLYTKKFEPVNGEWKMIENKLRWTLTTGSQETNLRIEVYEGYGLYGWGENLLMRMSRLPK